MTTASISASQLRHFPRSLFTVTESTHGADRCPGCREAARSARIHASVTGSVGATYTWDGSMVDMPKHSATVSRVWHPEHAPGR